MASARMLAAFAAAVVIGGAGLARAADTVEVKLWDKGPESLMMDDAHMKMMGKLDHMAMSMGTMGISVDKDTVAAGKVTFKVTNTSKDIIHEMIVSPVPSGAAELPYIIDENAVDEEAAHSLGEVSELDPGKGGELTVELTPGTYILYCNVPGHFIDGMWMLITAK